VPQFAVYRNKYLQGSGFYPLLVDVQSELLAELGTTVVIPLAKAGSRCTQFPLLQLMPTIEIEGERYTAVTTRLAGISRSDLGPHISSAAAQQHVLLSALDLMLRGF